MERVVKLRSVNLAIENIKIETQAAEFHVEYFREALVRD